MLATGRKQTIRDFVNMSFAAVDIQLEWSGSGEQEQAEGLCFVCGALQPPAAVADAHLARTQYREARGTIDAALTLSAELGQPFNDAELRLSAKNVHT